MTQPFVGQIQPFGFNFAPRGWAQCNGQTMAVSQNPALFALIGTMYGGNGTSTYQLPNLQSRVPMHFGTAPSGTTYYQGQVAGEEIVTLNINMLPLHNHNFVGSSGNANSGVPAPGQALAKVTLSSGTPDNFYGPNTTPQPLNPACVAPAGSNQPHQNLQPYLAINFCIALQGIFPSRG